ncbi:MAG: 23S rRNA (adenine(1618)-N(6))-methyltransferase RlmF [Bacteroidetes bacterium]|nr:23S rRNA (adenine(1618)-N(6))-methyltransferase RlmF [Bacteroidota bacterium]
MASNQGNRVITSGLLHPRNPHKGRYDIPSLCKSFPALEPYIIPNPKGDNTIDFSDPNAVLCLNKALLAHYYQVTYWQIPEGYLCPPIPGRADYIHYAADLLAGCNRNTIPTGKTVSVLDIGTGANCVYPIIGSQSYGWQFTAADIDPVSIKTANMIIQSNACLKNLIMLKLQRDNKATFKGIIKKNDKYDLTICNPPFYASMAEAQAGSRRKWQNLNKGNESADQEKRNFGGQNAELWCSGGEIGFLRRMAGESMNFGKQVCWFSSLVSKSENIKPIKKLLLKLGTTQIEVVKMSQGQKISRFIAWTFLTNEQQEFWAQERWN